MAPLTFYIFDVFAEEQYAGNQLAVFRHVDALSTDDMQRLAKETNYAETTFILAEEERDGGYDVRIFTPESEVPFAGHPTLGTAFAIQQEILNQAPIETLVLNLKVGQIPVRFTYYWDGQPDLLWMRQINPEFGQSLTAIDVAPVLNLDPTDIDDRFPIQEVSTGLPFVIIPLKNLDAVQRATPIRDRYMGLVENLDAKALFVFCPETYAREHDLNARMFGDYYGVPEDPATGSANGCLAGYLVKHRYFAAAEIDVQVEQGYEIKRPSLLYLQAGQRENEIEVNVGGRVIKVAEGVFV